MRGESTVAEFYNLGWGEGGAGGWGSGGGGGNPAKMVPRLYILGSSAKPPEIRPHRGSEDYNRYGEGDTLGKKRK